MDPAAAPTSHIPVLLDPLLAAVAPVQGTWIDGTFGAGGYAQALVDAGAERVIGIDRDPQAHAMAAEWLGDTPQISLHLGTFSELDTVADSAAGVVLDIGVSSMQIDEGARGFSFMKDGPLDMRMSQEGPSAADIINGAKETEIAEILFRYGEERASRRIARAIIAARPLTTTLALAEVIEGVLPRKKPGQSHPATRSFQALRIAVNDEYGELAAGLSAAERVLAPGGHLAVVTFHSVEDRMVKRFFQLRSSTGGGGSRHAPERAAQEPGFEMVTRKAVGPDQAELSRNPRARSARLRVGRRTSAAARPVIGRDLGQPQLSGTS